LLGKPVARKGACFWANRPTDPRRSNLAGKPHPLPFFRHHNAVSPPRICRGAAPGRADAGCLRFSRRTSIPPKRRAEKQRNLGNTDAKFVYDLIPPGLVT